MKPLLIDAGRRIKGFFSNVVNTILLIIVVLLPVVILNVGVNAVWIGAQKLWHYNEQRELDEIKAQMKSLEETLKADESRLAELGQRLDVKSAELDEMKRGIHTAKARYPDGLPRDAYEACNELISRHNGLCDDFKSDVGYYNGVRDEYQKRVSSYNLKVASANYLSRKIGGISYLIISSGHSTGRNYQRSRAR